jgi:lipopolysaccharide/colanic/teichoic acid biosynthesis glycosyltransferase
MRKSSTAVFTFLWTLFVVVLFLPLFITIYVAMFLFAGRPVLFQQKRLGKSKKPFMVFKFRTMIVGAEKVQEKYKNLNEADGPVFKIHNDPRFTKFGKFLSRSGLDELPQLLNVLRGEMSLVGPRPLPVNEAKKVPKKYRKRFSVLPGITSPWVVLGSHKMSFREWMELDLDYVNNNSFLLDFHILISTTFLMIRWGLRYIFRGIKNI